MDRRRVRNATVKIAQRTITGSLKKEVERFLSIQEHRDQVTWSELVDHIKKSFLSANEKDRLKAELEKIKQSSYESLGVYNRRFREAANKAYPHPRSEDAERTIMQAYARGLYNNKVFEYLMVENCTEKLEDAIKTTEQRQARIEKRDAVNRLDTEEPMEINPLNPSPPMTSQQAARDTQLESLRLMKEMAKQMERTTTRVAKLEARLGPIKTPGHQNCAKGAPHQDCYYCNKTGRRCYYCNKPGHIADNCFKKKRAMEERKKGSAATMRKPQSLN